MNRKNLSTVAIALVSLVAMFALNAHRGIAQEKPKDFSHVIAIDAGQGTIRFFDTITGRLYTYDRTLQQVIRIVELQELGEPAKIIQAAQSGDNRYSNPRENW